MTTENVVRLSAHHYRRLHHRAAVVCEVAAECEKVAWTLRAARVGAQLDPAEAKQMKARSLADFGYPDPDDCAGLVELTRQQVRDLERAGRGYSRAVARVRQLRREIVFLRHGVDVDSDPGRWITNGYDGELTSGAVGAFLGGLPEETRRALGIPEPEPESDDGVTLEPGEAELTTERDRLANRNRETFGYL